MPGLPKFIVGDDGGDRDFVIHCHYPKFILEFDHSGHGKPIFLDSENDFITLQINAGIEPTQTLAALLREAGDFFMEQLQKGD